MTRRGSRLAKYKCPRCRSDHKPCVRKDPDQPCDRCGKYGHECLASVLPDANVVTPSPATVLSPSERHFSSDQRYGQRTMWTPQHLRMESNDSSISSSMSGVEVEPEPEHYGMPTLLALLGIMARFREDCSRYLNQMIPWSQEARHSHTLCQDFLKHQKSTKELISWLVDAEHRLRSTWSLRSMHGSLPGTDASQPSYMQTHSNVIEEQVRYCCAKFTTGRRRNSPSDHSWEDYVKVEQHFANILSPILAQKGGREFSIIPAAYIAYLNRDFPAVLNLWESRPGHRRDKDFLGRELPHVLVECEDASFTKLGKLLKLDPHTVANVGPQTDLRGLSLLSLMVLNGNSEGLLSLSYNSPGYPDPKHGSFILDLALLRGDKRFVEQLIPLCPQHNRGIVLPPFEQAAEKAIELGRADLAECFMPWLSQECWNDPGVSHRLSELARRQGSDEMRGLGTRLQSIASDPGSRQQASADVDSADQFLSQHEASCAPRCAAESLRAHWTRPTCAQTVSGSSEQLLQNNQPGSSWHTGSQQSSIGSLQFAQHPASSAQMTHSPQPWLPRYHRQGQFPGAQNCRRGPGQQQS